MTNKQPVKEFLIYNRNNTCIFHIDLQESELFNKANQVLTDKNAKHRLENIYGLLFSLRSYSKQFVNNNDTLKNFSTSQYKLHYYEFINGLRFVILSAPTKTDYSGFLKEIFKCFYVNMISNNTFTDNETYINNTLFTEAVGNYLKEINV